MISKDEFRNYVKTIVQYDEPSSKKSENTKITSKSILIFSIIIVIVGIILIFGVNVYIGAIVIFLPIAISLIIIFITALRCSSIKFKPSVFYNNEERKSDVVNYLLKGYDYSYDKDGGIDISEYKKSPMYFSFEKYEAEDYLRINVSNDPTHKSDCWLNICDLRTYDEVEEEKNDPFDSESSNDFFSNDYEIREVDAFNGSFGYIQFNESFKTNLYINCPSSSFNGKTEYVKLEDINFNKKFWVYSTDQVEARYILNPRTMELINELNNKVNGGVTKVRRVISIALVGNRMYFTFDGGFKLFELNKRYHDPSEIFDDFYDDIEIILNLVKEIQMNNKIFKI